MPYVRYRGPYAVLVHSFREGKRVVQRHLAYLGKRSAVEPELRLRVELAHPDLEFDWERLESMLRGGRKMRASTWLEED